MIKKNYEKACERYQSLPKDEYEAKQQYGHERYKNLSGDKNKSWLNIEKKIL